MKSLLLLISLFSIYKSHYIKFPFKKYSKYQEGTNYFDYLEKNDLYITLQIGTPPQEIPIFLNFESYIFYISGLNLNGIYNEKKTSTFKYRISNRTSSFYSEQISEGYDVIDTIKLNDINNNKLELNTFNFIIPTKITKNQEKVFLQSSLGLKMHDSVLLSKTNLIMQLKDNSIVDSFGWTIKYINEDEGELIIGGYPHEYDSNFDENFFRNTKAEVRYSVVNWDLLFDNIYSGKKEIDGIKHVELDINLGFIRGITSYEKLLNEQFFNLKTNCKKENSTYYFYFICDKNEKISDFPNLEFYHKEFQTTFIFTYKELFVLKDNKYYCLIVFDNTYKAKNWRIGKPFFKKYQLSFESDRKLIVFYNGKKGLNFLWMIVILLLIIIIILIFLMIKKYISLPRKIRANELNEDIEYLIQEEKKT